MLPGGNEETYIRNGDKPNSYIHIQCTVDINIYRQCGKADADLYMFENQMFITTDKCFSTFFYCISFVKLLQISITSE
jgi:hypothetical protein